MKKFSKYAAVLLMLLSSNAFSQNTAEITGRVVERFSNQPVADAVIEINRQNIKTGSDSDGFFIIKNLEPGEYSIKVSAIGFNTIVLDQMMVSTGKPADVLIQLEIMKTEEIVVQAERYLKPVNVTTSFKNLQNEEIRRSPGGFEDIGRVVQTLPGVSFVNDGRNDLVVRGGSPSENLFLVDNSVVPNINHFGSQGATGGPLSIIDLNFVREVNFLTGGFSARYGDKLSSVLDIKLREGSREKFSGDINLSGNGFGGILEGPIGSEKKGSWLFSARRSYLDLFFNAAGFGFVPEYSSAEIKVVYDINKTNTLTVNAIGNYDLVRFNNETEDNRRDNENILKDNQWGYVNSYELRTLVSRTSYTLLNLTRNYINYDFSGRDANFNEKFANRSNEGETNLSLQYFSKPFKTTEIAVGSGVKLINFVNEIKSLADTLYYSDPGQIIIPAVNLNQDNNSLKGFAFIEVIQNVTEKFKFNAGLRYDYFGFINKKNYVSPRLSMSYNILKNLFVNLSYGIFYQSPSYIWLISNPQNKDLTDIRADHYVAGLEYVKGNEVRATLEVYYKKYSDYPASSLRPYFVLLNNGYDYAKPDNFGLEPLVSAGKGYSQGIEFSLQRAMSDRFYAALNLSFFKARYTSLDGIERRSDFDNQFMSVASAGYKAGRGWEFSGKIRLYGGRPYTPINPLTGIQQTSQYNSARLPNYFSLDLRADKRFNFSKWSLIVYADIQNITAHKNVTSYEWDKYKKEIKENKSLGIFPTVGVNITF